MATSNIPGSGVSHGERNFSFMLTAINGRIHAESPPPTATTTRRVPHGIEIKERNFSFMLTSINGRSHFRELEARVSDKSTAGNLCHHCSQPNCVLRCRECDDFVCDICIRTLRMHDSHTVTLLPQKDVGTPPASFCNACGCAPLTSPYYHCTVCDDYDLCDTCERLNDTLVTRTDAMVHNPLHPMIKYRTRGGLK